MIFVIIFMSFIILSIMATCNSLKKENETMHKKLDLLLKNAEITFIDDKKMKDTKNTVNQLYAEGDMENAKKLEKTLNPFSETKNNI